VNRRLPALLFCLAGILQAQPVYKFYVPHAAPVSRIETASPGAGWEVTVSYDTERCVIACTYRRMRFARLLAPPVVALRIYADSASKPETVIVDPTNLRLPAALKDEPTTPDPLCLPARSLLAAAAPPIGPRTPIVQSDPSPSPARPTRTAPTHAPVRI
jgi:hypothetical protein